MSVDDFCRMTPPQFSLACQAADAREQARRREGWEQARLVAVAATAPFRRGRSDPRKLIPLPWDRQQPDHGQTEQQSPAETREQERQRYLWAKRIYGIDH